MQLTLQQCIQIMQLSVPLNKQIHSSIHVNILSLSCIYICGSISMNKRFPHSNINSVSLICIHPKVIVVFCVIFECSADSSKSNDRTTYFEQTVLILYHLNFDKKAFWDSVFSPFLFPFLFP